MGELNDQTRHWTESSVGDFLYRIGADYVSQLENAMEATTPHMSQDDLSRKLKVSKGRVSQVLNSPGNLNLKTVIEYARAIGKKVAIVLYDDGDPKNNNGPINSQIFTECWSNAGKPSDFFDLQSINARKSTSQVVIASSAPDSFWPEKALVSGIALLGIRTLRTEPTSRFNISSHLLEKQSERITETYKVGSLWQK